MFTDLVLENQFGEVSQNKVLAGSGEGLPIAAHSVLANLSGSSALPVGATLVSLTAAQLLTGYVSGAGSVSATDNLLQAIQKLNGNAAAISTVANAALPSASFTAAAVTAKLITGFVSGAGSVTSADSILTALNKLDGNVALALPIASFTSAAVTAKVLTGLAAGVNTSILSTDTILVALANLQAQIDAL